MEKGIDWSSIQVVVSQLLVLVLRSATTVAHSSALNGIAELASELGGGHQWTGHRLIRVSFDCLHALPGLHTWGSAPLDTSTSLFVCRQV